MPSTPIYLLPYPSLSDPPNGAAQIQALAEAVEDELDRIESVPSPVSGRNNTNGTTTSTSYVTSLTTAGTCGVAFVAPPSGKITVLYVTAGFHGTVNAISRTAFRIGSGSTVGGGSEQYAAQDQDQISWACPNTAYDYRIGASGEVTGLIPGTTYNVCMAHKTTTGTATFTQRFVKIISDV